MRILAISSLLMMLWGCGKADIGDEDCGPSNHCSMSNGVPTCDDGFEWEEPDDKSNLRCVTKGSACEPESDQDFCARNEQECGELSANDNCGTQRTTNCGACADYETECRLACNVQGGAQNCTSVDFNSCVDQCVLRTSSVASNCAQCVVDNTTMTEVFGACVIDDGYESSACSASCSDGKRVFVTNGSWDADFQHNGNGSTGIEGADNLCNTAAQAALLGGTWKAWISDDTVSAVDRIADVGPWKLLSTNETVFHNKAGLGSTPLVPINRTESGISIQLGEDAVWTGTLVGGQKSTANCQNWSDGDALGFGTIGDANATTGYWTNDTHYNRQESCSAIGRLYCLEQ